MLNIESGAAMVVYFFFFLFNSILSSFLVIIVMLVHTPNRYDQDQHLFKKKRDVCFNYRGNGDVDDGV